jgi:hypothetical protein
MAVATVVAPCMTCSVAGDDAKETTATGTAHGAMEQSLVEKEAIMSKSAVRPDEPRGYGSVRGVQELPEGFSETFRSNLVQVGDLRLYAVTGGKALRCCWSPAGHRLGMPGGR